MDLVSLGTDHRTSSENHVKKLHFILGYVHVYGNKFARV